jgi:hypothetical protein
MVMRTLVVVLALSGVTALAGELTWRRLDEPGIPPMFDHSAAYDSGRQKLVVFGGTAFLDYNGWPRIIENVWEWDEAGWSAIPDSGLPYNVTDGGMVYDSTRDVCVYFGGMTWNRQASNVVAEWDGKNWTVRKFPLVPDPRYSFGMAYDDERDRVVVFGGTNGFGVFNDTWEYDGNQWRKVSDTGPPGRHSLAMAYDPNTQKVMLHGGIHWANYQLFDLADTWTWDGNDWTRVDVAGTAPYRNLHAMGFDPARNRMVLYGAYIGHQGARSSMDTWEFDGNQWHAIELDRRLLPRDRAALVTDSKAGSLTLIGGNDGLAFSEVWRLGESDWIMEDPAPTARFGASMVYEPTSEKLILFGGGRYQYLADTWTFFDGQWTRLPLDTSPSPRAFSAMCWDEANEEIVLFGGKNSYSSFLADTWIFRDGEWISSNATGPPPSRYPRMYFDRNLNKVVLIAGEFAPFPNTSTWVWDGSSWTMLSSTQPWYVDLAVFDENIGTGIIRSSYDERTWYLSGTNWVLQPHQGSIDRSYASTVYHRAAGRIVSYGGIEESWILDDMIEWNGTAWIDLPIPNPGPLAGAAIAYDSANDRAILFGGTAGASYNVSGNYLDHTWSLEMAEN